MVQRVEAALGRGVEAGCQGWLNEKDAALQMIAEKRKLAEEERKNVSNSEQVAQVLGVRAQDSRGFADKIRES